MREIRIRTVLRVWTGFLIVALLSAKVILPASSAESELTVPGPIGPLKGAFVEPLDSANPHVALINPGSGPINRDGNGPVLQTAMYRLLAEGLAQREIASLRLDKRGLFSSAAAVRDPNAVTLHDYADDMHAWIKRLKKKSGANCIWIIGHSEGGLVALVASAKPADICGLVLMAAPGRPIGEILREQMRRFAKTREILEQSNRAISALEEGQRVDTTSLHPALRQLFREEIQGLLINMMQVDPAKLLSGYGGPVLILSGLRDIQVSPADARRLKNASPTTELHLLPDTNHVFKVVTSDDLQANLKTYRQPTLPLAAGVLETIAQFIKTHSTRKMKSTN